MPTPKPLFWHQGLFLQPQHFQLLDKLQAHRFQALYTYTHPHFWGVGGLAVQEAALGNKSFEVVRGEFIFPDGTYVVFPGNATLPPRSFDEGWVEAEKPLTVFVGLSNWNQAGPNVTKGDEPSEAGRSETRFFTPNAPEEIPDDHGGGPPAKVRRMNYVLRIFWENEKDQLDNYNLLPVAQLERSGEEIRLVRKFIPPCPTVSASEDLVGILKEIRDQVVSRCRQLEEYKSPKEVQTMGFDVGYFVFLLALRSLNRYVPALMQITETKHIHPFDAYGLLRQFLGELSTFTENLTATGEDAQGRRVLPSYDHLDLSRCFGAAHRLVGEVLDSITVSPGQVIRLDYDGTYFAADPPERIFDRNNRFWLALRTEAEADTVVTAAKRVAKLSARKSMTTLIARAVPGVPLEYYPTPPPGLPRRANTHYFRIDHTSTLWLDIIAAGNVSMFWDTPPDDLAVDLVVLRS